MRNEQDDKEIWKALIKGERSALNSLYQKYFKELYRYGRKISHSKPSLEDAIHDLFVDLWRYHQNLSETSSIKFYLFRSLRRRFVLNQTSDVSSSIFSIDAEDFLVSDISSLEESWIDHENRNEQIVKLKKNLNNLSSRQYEALMLRFYNDFSYEEIGSLLEVNEQSARNLVQRGLQQLKTFAKITASIIAFWCISIL